MSEAEKMAERLEAGAFDFNADGPCWPGDDMAEAAALIRRLQAENEAKDALRMQGEAQVASLLVEIARLRAENESLSRDNKYLLKINQNLQRELIRLSY